MTIQPPPERTRYYDGEFLQSTDFQNEQAYHVVELQQHGALLHAPGITQGFTVTVAGGTLTLTLTIGAALDADGNQIVITTGSEVFLNGSTTPTTVTGTSVSLPLPTYGIVDVWVTFYEVGDPSKSPTPNSPGVPSPMYYMQSNCIQLTQGTTAWNDSAYAPTPPPPWDSTAGVGTPLCIAKYNSSTSQIAYQNAGAGLPTSSTLTLSADASNPGWAALVGNLVVYGQIYATGDVNSKTGNFSAGPPTGFNPPWVETQVFEAGPLAAVAIPARALPVATPGQALPSMVTGLVRRQGQQVTALEGTGFAPAQASNEPRRCEVTFDPPFPATPVVLCNVAPPSNAPTGADHATRCDVVSVGPSAASFSLTDDRGVAKDGYFSFIAIGRAATSSARGESAPQNERR